MHLVDSNDYLTRGISGALALLWPEDTSFAPPAGHRNRMILGRYGHLVDRIFAAPSKLRDSFDGAIDGFATSDRAEILAGTAPRIYRLETIQHEEH